ncbi:MAG: hypothetical protein ACRDNG_11900 [Gaiellaceae bacterium]
MDGWFVSNEYPTFDVDTDHATPEFVRLAIARPRAWREMASRTVGMGHRRQRLHPDAFVAFEIELPSLDEQRSIVDVIDAVGWALTCVEAERDANDGVLQALRETLIGKKPWDMVSLGEVVEDIEGGKSPRCLDRQPDLDEWGVLKLSAIRPGVFRDSEAKALPEDVPPFEKAEIRSGDVIITRSNTRERVGAVCRVEETRPRLLLCDLTWRLHFNAARLDSGYLVDALATRESRAQIEGAATGTSDSMRKISRKVLREVEIPLPPLDDQAAIANRLSAVRQAGARLDREAARLAETRASLVESLLLGEHRVAKPTAR